MQGKSPLADGIYPSEEQQGDRLAAVLHEMEYLNTIGKRFVAAIDRFQVHRALLAALQELYHFSACSILLKDHPFQLSVIPCYPLSSTFLQSIFQRIANAANVMDFPHVTVEEIAATAYLDAPDELAQFQKEDSQDTTEVGACLNIPLTVDNRIIGLLSLFDQQAETFDTDVLKLTTMIADYAAVALENVRLRERETALWREAELERQRLELIIASMAEGLLITNAHGAITSLNHSAQYLLAHAQVDLKQDIPLQALAERSNVPWLHTLAEIVQEALAGHVVMNQELIAGENDETAPLTFSVSAAPLHDAIHIQSSPIGVVAVINDVTAQKQIEKLKDEFVSVVSHELRTPLTAIKGYTQYLVRRFERRLHTSSQEEARLQNISATELPESIDLRSLNIVQSQAEHLERLVNDLLDLSRVQWGHMQLNYTNFYLADLLTQCVRSAQVSTEEHIISLDIQIQDTMVAADRVRIHQVVGNILDNAVKYSPHGGQVTVKLEKSRDEYLVSIIDQGIGISPEYLDHIFERFYRVRNTASRQYSGIGLGLYVAKLIIEEHGGCIGLTTNPGVGSTFYFTLPCSPPAA